ncbi:MAG TPA: hypothetical protein VMS86_00955 [Thermoanaerobaculia bacterium]|nr:hypothetical protein [Thermoanaerobaculia bacterium]
MTTVARPVARPRGRSWQYGQLGELRGVLIWSYGAVAAGLLVPIAARLRWGIPTENFLRDPAAITGAPPYVGLFSNVGVLLWAAAATICLFVAVLVGRSSGARLAFWWYAGVLTLALLIDDLFLFHEVVFPYHLHVPEPLVYAAYGLATAGFLALFHRRILGTDAVLLGLALAWFAASLAVDHWGHLWLPRGFFLVEDGLKLLGIVSWLLYFARTGYSEARALALGH